jgi:hypothetical protein
MLGKSPSTIQLVKVMADLVTDASQTDKEIETMFSYAAGTGSKYFRFNVDIGLSDIRLHEWQSSEVISSTTMDYLDSAHSRGSIQRCIEVLSREYMDRFLSPELSAFETNHPREQYKKALVAREKRLTSKIEQLETKRRRLEHEYDKIRIIKARLQEP